MERRFDVPKLQEACPPPSVEFETYDLQAGTRISEAQIESKPTRKPVTEKVVQKPSTFASLEFVDIYWS